ncbi:MAG: hypothetical protein K2M03_01480 [Muribaculaceae bacterium]|nr:hypothetical protein [Muribaculaceae bacterium]
MLREVIISCVCLAAPYAQGTEMRSVEIPVDYTAACDYIDIKGATGAEGLWEYPGDGITVLIVRDDYDKYKYSIRVVESDDVRLKPGMLMGHLYESAQAGKYRMSLYTSMEHGLPAKLKDCYAVLSKDMQTLTVESAKVTVKVGASTLLPVFWNKLRLSLRLNVTNPLEKLPEGLRRIYPSYDGNGSSLYHQRIL